jgi:hypothetical protein
VRQGRRGLDKRRIKHERDLIVRWDAEVVRWTAGFAPQRIVHKGFSFSETPQIEQRSPFFVGRVRRLLDIHGTSAARRRSRRRAIANRDVVRHAATFVGNRGAAGPMHQFFAIDGFVCERGNVKAD